MPTTRICATCQGHNATNYRMLLVVPVPEVNRNTSVNAGTIDLCDNCWNRLTNKRTLTLEGVARRAEQRREHVIARNTPPMGTESPTATME